LKNTIVFLLPSLPLLHSLSCSSADTAYAATVGPHATTDFQCLPSSPSSSTSPYIASSTPAYVATTRQRSAPPTWVSRTARWSPTSASMPPLQACPLLEYPL
jgi:hypothetical protein